MFSYWVKQKRTPFKEDILLCATIIDYLYVGLSNRVDSYWVVPESIHHSSILCHFYKFNISEEEH